MVSVNIRPSGLCSALPDKYIYVGPSVQYPTFHLHLQSLLSHLVDNLQEIRLYVKELAVNLRHFINSTFMSPGMLRTGEQSGSCTGAPLP